MCMKYCAYHDDKQQTKRNNLMESVPLILCLGQFKRRRLFC